MDIEILWFEVWIPLHEHWSLGYLSYSQQHQFILALLRGLKTTRTWEQQLANEYLKKMKGNMSFRLFPKMTHANVGVMDQRTANKQAVNLTAVHLGYVHANMKLLDYQKRGFWHPGPRDRV